MHLSWLRRKLGETAQEARYPHTVRRVGVRLAAPPEPGSADAPAAGRPGIRLMRQRLALLVSATMALVLVTFIVPLAIGVRVIVAGRAVSEATDDVQTLSALIAADPSPADVRGLAAATGRPVTVFLPGQQPIGVPAGQTPDVRLAARQNTGRTAEQEHHGRRRRRPGGPGRGAGSGQRHRGGPDLRQRGRADQGRRPEPRTTSQKSSGAVSRACSPSTATSPARHGRAPASQHLSRGGSLIRGPRPACRAVPERC